MVSRIVHSYHESQKESNTPRTTKARKGWILEYRLGLGTYQSSAYHNKKTNQLTVVS